MKILTICDFYSDTQQYQESFLTKYYLKLGHEVTIISSLYDDIKKFYSYNYDKNKASYSQIITSKYKVFHLRYYLNIFNKIQNFSNVYQIILDVKPDLIFIHGIHFNLHNAVKYKKQNPTCKIIMDYHGDFSNSGKNWISIFILHRIIRKIYLFIFLKYIDAIYPITPSSKKFLELVYGLKQKIEKNLPLGVDFDKSVTYLKSNSRDRIRKEYSINMDDIVIFTAGKLYPYKKTDQLIDAVNKINNTKIHLFVVGDAFGDLPYYQLLLEKGKVNQNIHFVGWKNENELMAFMSASDLAIYPSSQSMLWQQSVGMGLVLIIGKFITINGKTIEQDTEYLNSHNNVITLQEKDNKVEEIISIINYFILNPDKLKELKINSLKSAEFYLSYEKIALETLRYIG